MSDKYIGHRPYEIPDEVFNCSGCGGDFICDNFDHDHEYLPQFCSEVCEKRFNTIKKQQAELKGHRARKKN